MTGFRLMEAAGWRFKMAEPEKALADYLHLHPQYDSPEAIEGLRLNPFVVKAMDWSKLDQYAALFNNQALIKRLQFVRYVILD